MVEHGVDKTMEVLGADSMAEMMGWSGGAIAWLEKLLGRKCFQVVCNIHTNELPLRYLITTLNGKSSSKDGFSGPIGKQLSLISNMERKSSFEAILWREPYDILKLMSNV